MQYLVSFLFLQSCILAEEKRAGCFSLIVFLLSCDFKYYVYLSHGAVGRFAVCDFVTCWSFPVYYNQNISAL